MNGKRMILRRFAAVFCALAILCAAAAVFAEDADQTLMKAPDFTLKDQYGETHKLSDYQGKVVFLNVWATWCSPCVGEMPEIEELYHELGENRKDVAIIGVACPLYDNMDEKGIIDFLKENGITYPVVIDQSGETYGMYVGQGIPTTWLIRADGNLMGYIEGALTKDMMLKLINKTLEVSQEDAA